MLPCMTHTTIILSTLAALFGIVFFIFGGYDDSPGAQGLGLIIFLSGVITLIRNK